MLGWLVARDISPHIPVLDKSGRTDGTWSRTDFAWYPENNQYIRSEGEPLKKFRRNYSDPNRGPTGKGVAKYQALKHTCQACPSKMQCCPKADARKITREEHEDARQVARDIAKTKQYAISMPLRKKVGMLFAHLKRILGLGRLRLRGPCGANDEFLLAATAQNLRKLAKIFSCTAANAQSLIEKVPALSSAHHFLHQQHVVFQQNRLRSAVRRTRTLTQKPHGVIAAAALQWRTRFCYTGLMETSREENDHDVLCRIRRITQRSFDLCYR